jgi:hypothetical protein
MRNASFFKHFPCVSVNFFCLSLFCAMLLMASVPSHAQSAPLSLGSVSFTSQRTCPAGEMGSFPLQQATCYLATISNCQSYSLGTIPTITAEVAISTPRSWNGATIVLLNGGDGEDYFGQGDGRTTYPSEYYQNDYQVVQVAWSVGQDWHDNLDQPSVKSIKYEACRPATLLNGIHQQFGGSASMCAQGHSAGAAELGYALAWYGASSYLDSVLLTSGPAFSNVIAGCQYPSASPYNEPVAVCTSGKCKYSAQQWNDCAQYDNGTGRDCVGNPVDTLDAADAVAGYTSAVPGNCNNYTESGQNTSLYDSDWDAMGVVSSGAVMNYAPKTSVYGFMCASTQRGFQPNNSAAQSWMFLDSITGARNTGFYRVDGCLGDEEIWGPQATVKVNFGSESGYMVSSSAMMSDCIGDHHRHGHSQVNPAGN